MSKKEIDSRYAADDLPPIKNFPAYFWRVFRKFFIFAFFGAGTLVIVALVFPFMRLFIRDSKKFRTFGHSFISRALEMLIHVMSWIRISTFKINDLKALRSCRGCVIVANHPSLLDVIYIIAFVRNAECIVKAGLKKGLVSGIVKALYIFNNVDFDAMRDECSEALHNGGNLIIFPEGTRTPRHGTNPYKKGAARIALYAGANVQPIHIGGNDKYGLGKNEPMWKANPTERYKYDFTVLPQIDVSKYAGLSETIAAKHLTEDMRIAIDSVQ